MVAIAMVFVLPNVEGEHKEPLISTTSTAESILGSSSGGIHQVISYRAVARCPTLLLPFLDVFICFLGNGLIESMLQPYAVQQGATIAQVGIIFLALGGSYMFVTPVAGMVSSSATVVVLISRSSASLLASSIILSLSFFLFVSQGL